MKTTEQRTQRERDIEIAAEYIRCHRNASEAARSLGVPGSHKMVLSALKRLGCYEQKKHRNKPTTEQISVEEPQAPVAHQENDAPLFDFAESTPQSQGEEFYKLHYVINLLKQELDDLKADQVEQEKRWEKRMAEIQFRFLSGIAQTSFAQMFAKWEEANESK